ncbi:MAG: non-hydrolyzing UDP-N-acetylglucosamine 2-epimerase [Kiritimatiellia bacterium]
MKKIVLLAGVRPNYMKIFPVWREIKSRDCGYDPIVVHTGQHYDAVMSDIFFRDFGMPPPDHFLGVGSGSHAVQTAKVMTALEPLLEQLRPDLLVVPGDVNSTLAGALTGVKMGIRVAHIEAGLRSFDRTMPEEINRIVTDSISDILLTSCRDADKNLLREGIPQEKFHFVGNVMIDSLCQILPISAKSDVIERLELTPREYFAVTLHRPSNVDEPAMLGRIMTMLGRVAESGPVIFPVHPRTRAMLQKHRLECPAGVTLLDPMGYVEFLALMAGAGTVVTDSGGIQEETSFLGIPCLTLRPNTERPVTICEGTNSLLDLEANPVETVWEKFAARHNAKPARIEGWDGHAAKRVVDLL